MVDAAYTLIIPTYNRPREFGALLHYLDAQKVSFKILVLDSSKDEIIQLNNKLIKKVNLNIDVLLFSSETPPFEKFWRGVQNVKTPFCSLCADDDVLITQSVEPIVKFLQKNPDHVAAHGFYFSFLPQSQMTISDLVYTRDVLRDTNPITRLQNLFQSYEAITYAIYKTPILEKIFCQLQSLDSLLGRELLGGALTAAMGKVKRLPLFYGGRALSASHFYENWHPVEMLMTSPDMLYQEYGKYREILVESLKESQNDHPAEDLYKLIDIIHFSYMSEFFAPNILSYLSQQVTNKHPIAHTMANLWPIIIQNQSTMKPYIKEGRIKSFLRNRKLFKPKPQSHEWPSELAAHPVSFSDNFKEKIQSCYQELHVPLKEALVTSMASYSNVLKRA